MSLSKAFNLGFLYSKEGSGNSDGFGSRWWSFFFLKNVNFWLLPLWIYSFIQEGFFSFLLRGIWPLPSHFLGQFKLIKNEVRARLAQQFLCSKNDCKMSNNWPNLYEALCYNVRVVDVVRTWTWEMFFPSTFSFDHRCVPSFHFSNQTD